MVKSTLSFVVSFLQVLYSVMQLLKIIMATGLSLTGLFDLVIMGTLFFAMPRARQVGWNAARAVTQGCCAVSKGGVRPKGMHRGCWQERISP